ncbi:MAG: GNAT family N-acetyltransferase [bacterium]
MSFVVRHATATTISEAHRIARESFPEEPPGLFAAHTKNCPCFRYGNTLIGYEKNRAACAVTIIPRKLRVGTAVLNAAGIADVCTAKEYRGRGCATQALLRAYETVKSENYDLSILFAAGRSLYSRLGWVPVRRWRFIYPARLGYFPGSDDYTVEEEEYHGRVGELKRLYRAWSAGVAGTQERSAAYWRGLWEWVAPRSGTLAVARTRRGEAASYVITMRHSRGLTVGECVYEPVHFLSVKNLLLRCIRKARETGLRRVVAHTGACHPLGLKMVQQGGCREEVWNLHVRVVNPVALARKLAPELERRVREAGGLEKPVFFIVTGEGGRSARMRVAGDGVETPVSGVKFRGAVKIDACGFFELAVGSRDPEETIRSKDGISPRALRTVFPRRDWGFCVTDHF